jgi:hypothetical protein
MLVVGVDIAVVGVGIVVELLDNWSLDAGVDTQVVVDSLADLLDMRLAAEVPHLLVAAGRMDNCLVELADLGKAVQLGMALAAADIQVQFQQHD